MSDCRYLRHANRLRAETLEPRYLLAADPIISEFLASNQSNLLDSNGQTPDWIEIHNAGDIAIDLSGWHLTDDPTELTKWTFPTIADSIIDVGEYQIVFAAGQGDPSTEESLRTNFKLSASGEYVALVSPTGTIVSEFGEGGAEYPDQFEDVSYGLAADGNVGYFITPTPGEANSLGIDGFVADTRFSVDRGYFTESFTVDITSATSGATIVYTVDGSEPTLSNGTQVASTTDETPAANVQIETTTTLRAAAFKTDFEPTNVDTQTYLFLDDVIQQPRRPDGFPTSWGSAPAVDYELDPQIVDDPSYTQDLLDGLRELPALSIASDVDAIFGSRGIYPNPQNDSLEAVVSAEWILPDGSTGFQIDAGLKVSGGASRSPNNSPKHSLSLRFRSEYGAGRLNYDLFEDSPVDSFDSLQLRALYNNSWIHWSSDQQHRATLIRDQFIRDSLLAMGQDDAQRGTYAHLYLNGLYWGVYNVHERATAAHYAEYHGGDEDDYDALNGGSATDGNTRSYNAMRSTVTSRDWAAIQEVLDVDNYIDWTIAQAYGGNADLKFDGNWRVAGGGSGDGLWRIYAWDSERTLEGPTAQPPSQMLDPLSILDDLVRIPEFVTRFGDRLQKHFFNDGALTPDAVEDRWNARADELRNAIVAESARWGDYRRDVHRRGNDIELYERDVHWNNEIDRLIEDYFPVRSQFLIDEYASMGWYPEVDAPVLQVNGVDQHGGELALNTDSIGFTVDPSQATVTESRILIGEDAAVSAFVPTDNSLETGAGPHWFEEAFVPTGWTTGTNGVGYENSASGTYDDFIGTDVQTAWNANQSSVYTRFEFEVGSDFADYERLTLNMTFDDGFVAYLNGEFIDVDAIGNRNFAPSTTNWQSLSSGDDRPDSVVLSSPVTFDLTEHLSLLNAGTNVLAIQGLSQSRGSSDMLILPELALEKTSSALPTIYYTIDGSDPRADGGDAVGLLFEEPFALSAAATVRARTFTGNQWSALVESAFTPAPIEFLQGDINEDGVVSFADFLILSTNFGSEGTEPANGDIDLDGVVGFADFLILSANFGNTA